MKRKAAAATAAAVPDTNRKFSLHEFNKVCDQFLSPNLSELVKIEARQNQKGEDIQQNIPKQFALTLYFLGPRAYNFLKKLLYFPSKRSLQRVTEKVVCRPGLDNTAVLKYL